MENGHTNGSASLQERLSHPETAAALNRLLDRLDTLEKSVDRMADLLEQGPAMTAMVGDMVDETVRQAADNGIDMEERLKTTLVIAEKLTAPEMADRLDQLLSLIDQAPAMSAMMGDMVDETVRSASRAGVDLESRLRTALQLAEKLTAPDMVTRLDQLLALADQAPGMAAMMGDMVDDTIRTASHAGVDIESRLRIALQLAEKLTAPDMVARLDQLLALADQAPGMAAMMGDIFDETYRNATASGINIEAMARQGAGAAVKLSQLMESPEFDALMASGVLDPEVVGIIGKAGQALLTSHQAEPVTMGPFALLRALNHPDMQRVMGFLVTFGKAFGQGLNGR